MKKTLIFLLALSMLLLSFPMPTFAAGVKEKEPNDEISKATSFKIGDKVTGKISTEDDEDYFKFVVSESGMLKIEFDSHLTSNYLEIFNKNSKSLWHYYFGKDSGTYQIGLEAGTYFFMILADDCSGEYSFSTKFKTSGATVPEPNDSIEEAALIDLNKKTYGIIAARDEDFYKIVLPESGRLTISFESFLSYYSLGLYNKNDSAFLLWESYENMMDSESDVFRKSNYIDLEAGTYFLRVAGSYYLDDCGGHPCDEQTHGLYNFTPIFVPAGATHPEPNNTFDEASPIKLGESVHGLIGAGYDDFDIYKFVFPQKGKLYISFNSYTPFWLFDDINDYEVWGNWGEDISDIENESDIENLYCLSVDEGTYYLHMRAFNEVDSNNNYNGSYTFTVYDESTPLIGDANLDGKVNTGDAAIILRYCASLAKLDEQQLQLADFNCDGNINTGDAAAILRRVVGLG